MRELLGPVALLCAILTIGQSRGQAPAPAPAPAPLKTEVTLEVKAVKGPQADTWYLEGSGKINLTKDEKGYVGATYYTVDDKTKAVTPGVIKTDANPEPGKSVGWSGKSALLTKGTYTVRVSFDYMDKDGKVQIAPNAKVVTLPPE